METIKRTVRVTIEKEIEIEIMPSMFMGMTEAEYLAEFRKGLWHVDSMDEVVMYAARMAATAGSGYNHDGIGLLEGVNCTFPRVPDVKFRETFEEIESEIVSNSINGESDGSILPARQP